MLIFVIKNAPLRGVTSHNRYGKISILLYDLLISKDVKLDRNRCLGNPEYCSLVFEDLDTYHWE